MNAQVSLRAVRIQLVIQQLMLKVSIDLGPHLVQIQTIVCLLLNHFYSLLQELFYIKVRSSGIAHRIHF